MRRLVWVAVGAVGGIVVYRRVERAVLQAREQGVVATVQQASASASHAVDVARQVAGHAVAATRDDRPPTPGAAAAAVVPQSDRGG